MPYAPPARRPQRPAGGFFLRIPFLCLQPDLITTPGITIRDRLQTLKPNDPDSYHKKP